MLKFNSSPYYGGSGTTLFNTSNVKVQLVDIVKFGIYMKIFKYIQC